MKNILIIFTLFFFSTLLSCKEEDDCKGGNNAGSPPLYPFFVFYLDSSTGENLLSMEEPIVTLTDIDVSLIEDNVSYDIGESFGSMNNDLGYFLWVVIIQQVKVKLLSHYYSGLYSRYGNYG